MLEYRKLHGANLRLRQNSFNDSPPLVEIDEFHGWMKMITACSVESYFSKESVYTAKMVQADAKTISVDHTFKVSANIHIMLQRKWIKLYFIHLPQ